MSTLYNAATNKIPSLTSPELPKEEALNSVGPWKQIKVVTLQDNELSVSGAILPEKASDLKIHLKYANDGSTNNVWPYLKINEGVPGDTIEIVDPKHWDQIRCSGSLWDPAGVKTAWSQTSDELLPSDNLQGYEVDIIVSAELGRIYVHGFGTLWKYLAGEYIPYKVNIYGEDYVNTLYPISLDSISKFGIYNWENSTVNLHACEQISAWYKPQ
jgi:hypothetical protein